MKIRRKELNAGVTQFGHVVWTPAEDPVNWQDNFYVPQFIQTSYGELIIRVEFPQETARRTCSLRPSNGTNWT